MQSLFSQLITPAQKNSAPAAFVLKLWLVIILSFWLFSECVDYAITHILRGFLISVSAPLLAFFVMLNIFIFFQVLNFVCNSFNEGSKENHSFLISFPSAPQMFVFSFLIFNVITVFGLIFTYIIILLSGTDFIYMLAYPFPLMLIFITRVLIIILSFFVFRKMLQLGWCGVIVEKK